MPILAVRILTFDSPWSAVFPAGRLFADSYCRRRADHADAALRSGLSSIQSWSLPPYSSGMRSGEFQ